MLYLCDNWKSIYVFKRCEVPISVLTMDYPSVVYIFFFTSAKQPSKRSSSDESHKHADQVRHSLTIWSNHEILFDLSEANDKKSAFASKDQIYNMSGSVASGRTHAILMSLSIECLRQVDSTCEPESYSLTTQPSHYYVMGADVKQRTNIYDWFILLKYLYSFFECTRDNILSHDVRGITCIDFNCSNSVDSIQIWCYTKRTLVPWHKCISLYLGDVFFILLYIYSWQIDEVSAFDDTRSSIDPLDNAIVPLDEFSVRTILRTFS